ncbi:MAG: hypothetical protein J6D26_05695 [Clostridia bacterium]|nr:hypothetical protein [Clostridia bacterium]
MKRFLSVLIVVSILITSFSITGYASFISDNTASSKSSVDITGKWKHMNDTGIIPAGKAVFAVSAELKGYKPRTYTVYLTTEGKQPQSIGTLKLIPGKQINKDFNLNLENGKHDLKITVNDKATELYSYEDEVIIMDSYEKQFMDEFSHSGINWTGSSNKLDPLYMQLFESAGFQGVRRCLYWSYVEKSKGVYEWSFIGQKKDEVLSKGIDLTATLAYGNGSVYPMWQSYVGKALPANADVRMAPHTQEGIRAYANFGVESFKRFPGMKNMEIWNEPNIGFWRSDQTTVSKSEDDFNYEYIDLLKATTATIRGELKNKRIAGLCFAHSGSFDELGDYLDYDILPYMTELAYHFYAVGAGIDDENTYENRLDKYESYVIDRGGWKPMQLTECGWHTGTASTARDEEYVAENLVKLYTICDQKGHELLAFSFNDAGTNEADKESTWGIIKMDGTPKEAYFTLAARNKQINGGVYVGELDLGDDEIRAFVYLKEGKPVVIIWDGSKDREEVEFVFDEENFSVTDAYGNLVSSNTDKVTLTKWPAYINGLSDKYIAMAAKEDVKYDRALYAQTYADMLPQDILTKADSTFANAEKALDDANEKNVKASIDEFTQLGLDIIDKFKSGEITDTVASRATYELSKTVNTLCTVYMSEYDGSELSKPIYTTVEAQAKADRLYRDDNRIMRYSDAILTYALNAEANALKLCELDYAPKDTKGYIAGWSLLTKVYCDWFDSFSDNESIISYGLLAQVLPESRKAYVNDNKIIKINANNYSELPFSGTIRLYDEENNEIVSSEMFALEEGGFKYIELPFNVQRYNDLSKRELTIAFVDAEGNRLHDERFTLKVNDSLHAFVQPCTTTVDKMDSVDLRFTNLTDEELKFKLNVESNENYQFASNTHSIVIGAKEEKIVELPVSEIKETKFHHYTVKYEAVNDEGIVIASDTVPLNFTAIVKAENEINPKEFNGDISDWYDAYPIYINSPENPDDKASWDNAEISARAFLKWDNDHLYLLIDAYDDVHYNYMTGTGIWDGDSVQISIDPKNTDSVGSYDSDDFELGMAIGGAGIELWAWQTPIKSSTGNVDFINIIRDDENKITRYIAAFPKAELSGLELADGNTFGMNIAINEADVLNRDMFYQFTKGTADTKNPSLYSDFSFTQSGNKDNYIDGKAVTLFPEKLGE